MDISLSPSPKSEPQGAELAANVYAKPGKPGRIQNVLR